VKDGSRAAFGPDPGALVRPPGVAAPPHVRWICAVTLGGQGRYAAAATLLGGLLADRRVPAAVAAHAAVTLASHRRQLGGHAAARPLDALGLRLATAALREGPARPDELGTDPAAARVDALVGLAADAIGCGTPGTARRFLDVAAPELAAHPSWRLRARAGWVRAELALVVGAAADAVAPAEDALRAARGGGSLRHQLKSRIILAVARSADDRSPSVAESALAELDDAGLSAARHGLLPLVWPARLAAADLLYERPLANEWDREAAQQSPSDTTSGPTRRRHAAERALSVILARTDPAGRRLVGESEWLPTPPPVV
jgi:hypothetical protein